MKFCLGTHTVCYILSRTNKIIPNLHNFDQQKCRFLFIILYLVTIYSMVTMRALTQGKKG